MHVLGCVVCMIAASIGLAAMKDSKMPRSLYRISFGTVVILFLTYAFVCL